jgi:hydroxyacylglutathione hydrolase
MRRSPRLAALDVAREGLAEARRGKRRQAETGGNLPFSLCGPLRAPARLCENPGGPERFSTHEGLYVPMLFRQWRVGPMANFVYVFGSGRDVALVDPGFEPDALVKRVEAMGCRVSDVLATHGHFDHVEGIAAVKKRTGATVWAHAAAQHPNDMALNDGDSFEAAGVRVKVVHTPGHTDDAVCYVVDGTHLLTGDTLFIGECGRVDLPGSDPEAMHDTLTRRLMRLDPTLLVCPGHDYGVAPFASLKEERATNYTLQPRSLDEFLRFMDE